MSPTIVFKVGTQISTWPDNLLKLQAHWIQGSILSGLVLHSMQKLHFKHLGHEPQASWDSSKGIYTGKGDHSFMITSEEPGHISVKF